METEKIIEKLQYVDDRIDIDESNLTPIQEFYKDTKIFITGGSGFLGQILIEKLLRSCPVSTIYVLIRNKKGKDMQSRLNGILDDQLFNRLKKACPNFRQKLVAVEGDCAMPDLGLNGQDKELLINEVNIIFHVAATVRFDEKLERAVAINVKAIRDLSFIAQKMPHLKSFMHVSTIFSNCIQDTITEEVCPAAMDYQQLIDLTDFLDDMNLENITPQFLGKYPNTYIYTKQIAESVVEQETKGLPVGIYKPAIVVSTYQEPIRGWINNMYGPTGLFYGSSLGLIRVIYADNDATAVCVPVDMCINGLIASAWDAAQMFQKSKEEDVKFEIPVYNCESSTDKFLTWREFKAMSSKYGLLVPSVLCIWVYHLVLIKSYNTYLFLTFLLHTVPAIIADVVMFCMGKNLRLLKTYKTIHTFSKVLGPFSVKHYNFNSTRIRAMLMQMSQKDRDVFFCDFKELDWDKFFMTYGAGARIYLTKDPLETIPEAKKKWRKLQWANRVVLTIVELLLAFLLYCVVPVIYRLIFM